MSSIGDYTEQLARTFSCYPDFKVAVLTGSDAQPSNTAKNIDVLSVAPSWHLYRTPTIVRAILNWRPDLVHIQYPSPAYGSQLLPTILPLCLRLYGLAVVQTWHFVGACSAIFRIMPLRFLSFWFFARVVFVFDRTLLEWAKGRMRWLFGKKIMVFIPHASAIPRVELRDAERIACRARYIPPNKIMVVYFGFVVPGKGLELIFDIADPEQSGVVIMGGIVTEDDIRMDPKRHRQHVLAYADAVRRRAESDVWKGKVTFTGFLPPREIGRVLSAADAVVLPFPNGCQIWNTSLHAALAQGSFVLTTSKEKHGYCALENIYYAPPNDVASMKAALIKYAGKRVEPTSSCEQAWNAIRDLHLEVYRAQAAHRLL